MRDFTAAGLNFSLKLGLMEYASSAAGIAARGNGGGEERQRTKLKTQTRAKSRTRRGTS